MNSTLLLPDLGEDINEGMIVKIAIAEGAKVSQGQTLFEVETDKVVVEVPADRDATVAKLLVQEGTAVSPGAALLEFVEAAVAESAATLQQTQKISPVDENVVNLPVVSAAESSRHTLPAGPSARRLARELGVDIFQVKGTGTRGRISNEDIKHFARQHIQQHEVLEYPAVAAAKQPGLPDFEQFGPSHRQRLGAIQIATKQNMTRAWHDIPHAWLQAQIDITELEGLRNRYKERFKAQQIPLTLTAFLVKALALAMQELPLFNASLDEQNDELVYRDYIDIGVAVDTPKGLLVPSIRSIEQKSISRIARDLAEKSQLARAGKLQLNDLQGAGMTLSNLGQFGLSSIYPLINWPQLSILGVATGQWQQVRDVADTDTGIWHERLLLPLTLAFDHRVINGADGARLLKHLQATLEEPFLFGL